MERCGGRGGGDRVHLGSLPAWELEAAQARTHQHDKHMRTLRPSPTITHTNTYIHTHTSSPSPKPQPVTFSAEWICYGALFFRDAAQGRALLQYEWSSKVRDCFRLECLECFDAAACSRAVQLALVQWPHSAVLIANELTYLRTLNSGPCPNITIGAHRQSQD